MLAHIFSLARGIWRLSKVYHTQAENPTVIQKIHGGEGYTDRAAQKV